MTKHLIVFAHPNSDSLNGHFKTTVESLLLENGHQVIVRDLIQMGFNPVLSLEDMIGQRKGMVNQDVKQEQEHVSWADCITFIYPIWWTGMPAVMKGYIDRVFTYGFAYSYDTGVQQGLLKGKSVIVVNTQGKSQEEYEASGMAKALSLTSDTGIFEYCGTDVKRHLFFDGAARASPENVEKWACQLTELFNKSNIELYE